MDPDIIWLDEDFNPTDEAGAAMGKVIDGDDVYFITPRNGTRELHMGPGAHPSGSDQDVHGNDEDGEDQDIQDPRWGKNAKYVDGTLVAQGKIGLAKDKWAVVKDDGEMGSNFKDTPEEAIAESNQWAKNAGSYADYKKLRDAAMAKAKNQEPLSKEDISIIAGYSSGLVSEQSGIGIVRSLGLRWTDARKVVSGTRVNKITGSGVTLRSLTDILESYYFWNNKKDLGSISGPTIFYLDGTTGH